jgi:hypothetical protein
MPVLEQRRVLVIDLSDKVLRKVLKMIPAAFFAVSFLLSAQAPAGQAKTPPALVRVFVHTDELGDGAELAARRDSVKDLREALAEKKKTVVIVPEKDRADVVVEVVDRAVTIPKVAFGVGPTAGPAGSGPATPAKAVHLKVKLSYGEKGELPFTNKNAPIESSGGWKAAADDIARQLDKWITAHREELLVRKGGLAISAPVH